MKRVATTTVIRGNGACEVYINGILKEEMQKLNKLYKAKEAELQASEMHLNRLLSHNLNTLEVYNVKNKSALSRILERIEILWCQFWGLCMAIGMWEYVGDEETQETESL